MKNQSNSESRSNTDKDLTSKEKRRWKTPEIIEENFRNTEQGPGLPGPPVAPDSTS